MLNLVSIRSMAINGKRPPDQFWKASDTPPSSAIAYHSLFFHARYQSLKDIQLPSIDDWQVKHRSSYGPTVFISLCPHRRPSQERKELFLIDLVNWLHLFPLFPTQNKGIQIYSCLEIENYILYFDLMGSVQHRSEISALNAETLLSRVC